MGLGFRLVNYCTSILRNEFTPNHLIHHLLQLYKVMNFAMQLIVRKVMNSQSWSIKGGEKKNAEAVEITRKIQELLKPGDGRTGIAYNFIDAQVRFIFRIQKTCKQSYFSVDSVHDLSLVYVCLSVSLGEISHESPSSKIFPFLLGRKAVSPRPRFSAISCVTHNCAQQMFTRNKSRCIKSRLRLTVAPSMETRLSSETWRIILSGRVEISSNYL